ncbi:MAG TPA: phosphate regulon transcriptional regulator PhoB [Burkholderiaceae bacterium]|jgi:two-component system phosphate regulon response regulator PhoB|nr:phosphate regulon transcriptional regulator PhoB [Burkholderiaceae bacterium]
MADTSILLVEDEPGIAELVRFTLSTSGYTVHIAPNVKAAQNTLQLNLPSAMILDWMLPDESGVKFLRSLRSDKRTKGLPVIMLTARGQEHDKVAGLDAGADDYVTKPFSPSELLARLRAVLRRRQPEHAGEVLTGLGLTLDPVKHRVTANGKDVNLGPTEFRLLNALMAYPGRVFSRQQLLDIVWGNSVVVEERTVDVHVLRLRKALAEAGLEEPVRTVRGVGYAFAGE